MAIFGIGKKSPLDKKDAEDKKKEEKSQPSARAGGDGERDLSKKREKEKATVEDKPAAEADKRSLLGAADLSWVLLRPRITEKATINMEEGMYTFEISPRANKRDVARAVQQQYKVEPEKVHIVRLPRTAFVSRMRGTRGVRSGVKKAYVFLKEGDRIELV